MTKGQPVQPSEPCSGTESGHAQTLDARDQLIQDQIDRRMVFVVADKVIEDKSHRKMAGEWMTPCNELF
jgi:hypothetical protein